MEIQEFINNFTNQFDEPEKVTLEPSTRFRELEDWNSLTALMTLSMADEVYGVVLPPEEMRSANTVQELFDLISSLQK